MRRSQNSSFAYGLAGVFVALFAADSQAVQARSAPPVFIPAAFTTECDRRAAQEDDPAKPAHITGVLIRSAEDASEAMKACLAAIDMARNNAAFSQHLTRYRFQYARAFWKSDRDENAALEMMSQVAKQDYAAADDYLAFIKRRGSRLHPYTRELDREILIHLARASDGGMDTATRKAAKMIELGQGFPAPDPKLAMRFWRRLAEKGDAEAIERLALQPSDPPAVVAAVPPLSDKPASGSGWSAVAVGGSLAAAAAAAAACYYWPDTCAGIVKEVAKDAIVKSGSDAVRGTLRKPTTP